jgi:hypothetical protein
MEANFLSRKALRHIVVRVNEWEDTFFFCLLLSITSLPHSSGQKCGDIPHIRFRIGVNLDAGVSGF